jgi:hypothetical protein
MPRNLTFSCAAGVVAEPVAGLEVGDRLAGDESAVHTMPAMAMTKNMPVVPERPKRNSTTEEMMMVSMVMPETGLLAVVAMALAATEAKKKAKSSVSRGPRQGWSRRA